MTNTCMPILLQFEVEEVKVETEEMDYTEKRYNREGIVHFVEYELEMGNVLNFMDTDLSFSDKLKIIKHFKELGYYLI